MPQLNIFEDDRKNAIYELQHYLRFIAKNSDTIPLINPDGIFGGETETAVQEFQKQYFLPVTGEVDKNTWNMLRDVYEELKEGISFPVPIYVFPVELAVMKKGDSFGEIAILQVVIRKIAGRYKNVPAPPITGNFDENTEFAVKTLQNIFGVTADGTVSRKTWNRLAKLYSAFTHND